MVGWIIKVWSMYTIDSYSAVKKRLNHAANFHLNEAEGDFMLSEVKKTISECYYSCVGYKEKIAKK